MSLIESVLDKSTKKEKHNSNKVNKAIEFIRTFIEKEEPNKKASASLATTADSSNTSKSVLYNIIRKSNNNS